MNEAKIRNPVQKRSIEKKSNIIKCGFDLICEKGYHNVNTADIAKAAGVSTGIIYNYFKDKKDIFLEGIKEYSNNIMYPLIEILDNQDKIDTSNLKKVLEKILDIFLKKHAICKSEHEEMLAMSHLDEDIYNIFKESEIEMTTKFANLLIKNGYNIKNLNEKIHICIAIIENLCHELIYHKHNSLNEQALKDESLNAIVYILEKSSK